MSLSSRWSCFLIVIFLSLMVGGKTYGATESRLVVGVYPSSPFIIVNENAEPRGFTIDLWKSIAAELHLNYYFLPSKNVSGVLEDVYEDRVDLALGAISITHIREQLADFTYPYFHTGLGIMIPKKNSWSFTRFAQAFKLKRKVFILGGIFLFIVMVGHIIWLVERRNKKDSAFHQNYFPGVFEGIYWAIVTASTVGYGDKVAKSGLGKIFVVLIILCALPGFAFFTAKLTSDITINEIRTGIVGPRDLINRQIGVLEGTTSQEYIEKLGCVVVPFDRIETAHTYLRNGYIDAVVHDRPRLLYYVEYNKHRDLTVLDAVFSPQDYGIALPEEAPLTEDFNRVLLLMSEDGRMAKLHKRWFGK